MNDYQTGTKTFVPKLPMPPPRYNAWRLQTYAPPEPADWPAFMAQLREQLVEWQARPIAESGSETLDTEARTGLPNYDYGPALKPLPIEM